MPPLGLALMAAYIRQEMEAEVAILDAAALRLDLAGIRERLRGARARLIGISATTLTLRAALLIARLVKAELPEATVVLGGVHPTVMPEEVLQEPAVDLVVRGEGEQTLADLVSGHRREDIPGLSYRLGKRCVHNPDRPLLPDLDTLPLPAYDLLPIHRYRPSPGAYKHLPSLSLLAGRGCPGACTFCCKAVFGQAVRFRNAGRIAAEMEFLGRAYGVCDFVFYDDTFTSAREEVLALCRLLIRKRTRVTWSCMSRADKVDEELLRAMRASGCHQICYGVESAEATIRRGLKKAVSLSQVRRAVALARRAGIGVRLSFMLGSPGETVESMRSTVALALELAPSYAQFNIATPYPGTEMFAWARRNGYLTTLDWDEYDLSRPVMDLPTVTQAEVVAWYGEAYRRFYRRPAYVCQRIIGLRSLAELRAALGVAPKLWRFMGLAAKAERRG